MKYHNLGHRFTRKWAMAPLFSGTAWNPIHQGRTYAMGGTTSWESWQVDKLGRTLSSGFWNSLGH